MHQATSVWSNLRHWSLHTALSASASFVFAYHTDWNDAPAVAGMVAGVVAFIALYTWVWSSRWFHRRVPPGSAGRRALLYGTRVRSTLGVLGLGGLLLNNYLLPSSKFGILFVPDLWAGMYAYLAVIRLGKIPFVRSLGIVVAGDDLIYRPHGGFINGMNALLPTFLITVAEGFLLTVVLLTLSALCRAFLGLYARVRPTPQLVGAGL